MIQIDFNFLLDLAKEMKDFNFSIVTDKISSCNLKNVNLINGEIGVKKHYLI